MKHKTHNKSINPFAIAHSDRRKAAAVYAKRYRAEESSAYLSGWKSPSGKG